MTWWLWVLVSLLTLYALCGVLYIIHLAKEVKRGGVKVEHWYGWLLNFALWPISLTALAAVNGMMM